MIEERNWFDTPASWVIRERSTGRVILETFERTVVEHLNVARYEAIPIAEYLGSINGQAES
jgi:hypothetical protein